MNQYVSNYEDNIPATIDYKRLFYSIQHGLLNDYEDRYSFNMNKNTIIADRLTEYVDSDNSTYKKNIIFSFEPFEDEGQLYVEVSYDITYSDGDTEGQSQTCGGVNLICSTMEIALMDN